MTSSLSSYDAFPRKKYTYKMSLSDNCAGNTVTGTLISPTESRRFKQDEYYDL